MVSQLIDDNVRPLREYLISRLLLLLSVIISGASILVDRGEAKNVSLFIPCRLLSDVDYLVMRHSQFIRSNIPCYKYREIRVTAYELIITRTMHFLKSKIFKFFIMDGRILFSVEFLVT